MVEVNTMVGRVLRASTTSFVLGCSHLIAEQENSLPEFGAFVKSGEVHTLVTYGLIYDVSLADDAFVQQLVAAGMNDPVMIEDHRQNRQVLVSVSVLILGHGRGNEITHRLPPQPPGTLKEIYTCAPAEIVRLTARPSWLRTVLMATEIPVEQVITAALRQASQARLPDRRESFLLEAGRELVRLCSPHDLPRAEAILRQLR